MNRRKLPKFQRHPKLKRINGGWRKPRGRSNKMRKGLKGKGKVPKIGYGAPKDEKYLHPCGKFEVLISNIKDLEKMNPETECGRISKTVGKKKRGEILKKAKELGIKILQRC